MRRSRAYWKELVFGLLGVALAAVAWADITNTAVVLHMDDSGAQYTAVSNTVVVTVSNPVVLPSTPTLNLSPYTPINATITAGYSGSYSGIEFQWTFTPQSVGSGVQAARAPSAQAPAATLRTTSASANLGLVVLGLGPYLVEVQAIDSSNNISAPARAFTTLVLSDLSSVKVYPNPWRTDKHSTLPITFNGLPVNTTVKIFSVSGHLVKSLPASSGSVTWDLTNDSGGKVASGIYMYLLQTESGAKATGKLAIVK